MFGIKKINLLPLEYKNKVLSRYIIISASAIGCIFVILILGMLINMGFLNMSINNLKKQNTEYNATKVKIADLEKQITNNQSFINEQKQVFFDFYSFMSCLENCKPDGLTIISVDSSDRMLAAKKETEEATPTATEEPKQNEKADETGKVEEPKQEEIKAVVYEKDLTGGRLVLRGLAKNAQDISTYIYKLSQVPIITSIDLSGIEEQTFNKNDKVTIFEAVLEVQ